MSWARDYLQEVKKLDPVVASRIQRLNLDPAEAMLLACIILFSPVSGLERFKRLDRLLAYPNRLSKAERTRQLFFLVHGKECERPLEGGETVYHARMMAFLRHLDAHASSAPARRERIAETPCESSSMSSNAATLYLDARMPTMRVGRNTAGNSFVILPSIPEGKSNSVVTPNQQVITRYFTSGPTRRHPSYGGIRCATCGCVHAPGGCPFVEGQVKATKAESKDEEARRAMGWSGCAPTDEKLDARHTAWWLADTARGVSTPAVSMSLRPEEGDQAAYWSRYWGMS